MKRREYHGMRSRTEYNIWAGIIQRCQNPKNPSFPRYGGRGISICEEWRLSFVAFLNHIGDRPSSEHTVDRIDGSKGYIPGNVRWATDYEQAQNKASTMWITAFGETRCLSEWARISGIPVLTIYSRIELFGWESERALTPAKKGRRSGEKLTAEEVCQIRKRAALGETGKDLSAEFGISHSAACRAIGGKTYAFDKAIAASEFANV
jgi:hypothetical protein